MASLTSLPCEALEEIFHQLDQHQTLALAPLHSKFCYIGIPKLYRNIYVYTPWPLNDVMKQNDPKLTFHIPKNLNNCKSKKYSIISSDTLERYLARMDETQKINHFQLHGHNMTIIDCIFRHFTKIKYFELVALYLSSELPDYIGLIKQYLDIYHHSTVYISPKSQDYSDNLTLFRVGDWHKPDDLESLDRSKNLTELIVRVCFNRNYRRFRFSKKLHVLRIYHDFKSRALDFTLCDVFDTSCLRELSIKGDISVKTLFSSSDLEENFPKLVQLCLRFAGEMYAPSALQDLKRFKHDKLKSLVVSSRTCLECEAKAVCDLCPQFPNSSINWWREPLDCYCMLLSHNIRVLSPDLPFGVVGYHFYDLSREDLADFEHTVTDCFAKEVKVNLKRWYTRAELYTIYNSGDHHLDGRREY